MGITTRNGGDEVESTLLERFSPRLWRWQRLSILRADEADQSQKLKTCARRLAFTTLRHAISCAALVYESLPKLQSADSFSHGFICCIPCLAFLPGLRCKASG